MGKVGRGVSVEQAYASARDTGLCLLATLKAELGDLRKVKRIVRGTGHGQRRTRVHGSSQCNQRVF